MKRNFKKVVLLIILLLIVPLNVKAETYSDYWGYDITHFERGQVFNCLYSDRCNENVTTVNQWGYSTDGAVFYPGFLSSSILLVENSYGAMFRSFLSDTKFLTDHLYTFSFYACYNSGYDLTPVNFYTGGATDIPTLNYPANIKSSNTYKIGNKPYETIGNVDTGYPGDNYQSCRFLTYKFVPTKEGNWYGVQFTGSSTFSSQIFIVGYKFYDIGAINNLTSSQVQKIVDNSTANLATDASVEEVEESINVLKEDINELNETQKVTNSKLDDLNDNITNDSVDNDQASSFFDNFSTTDHGGISGIITAPLTAINAMLNKNCSPLTATYKGKEISLPCGYDFWEKMPTIQEFINITLGGLLCYKIICKLYRLIENLKNPDDDRVEVMKL